MTITITSNVALSGAGLWNANSIQAFFLKQGPAYLTSADPRLPKYDFLAANLQTTDDQILVSSINLFPNPSTISAEATVRANTLVSNTLLVPVSSTAGIVLGVNAITANIGNIQAVTVEKIYSANSSILLKNLQSNLVIAKFETIYFYPVPQVGAVRIGPEVIWYDHAWSANSTLTGITRNVLFTPGFNGSVPTVGNVPAGNLVSILGLRTPLGTATVTGIVSYSAGSTTINSSYDWNYLSSVDLQLQVEPVAGITVGSTVTTGNISRPVMEVWANGNIFLGSVGSSVNVVPTSGAVTESWANGNLSLTGQVDTNVTISAGETIYFTLG
jgi:hypothetical protein